jgi:hypothetical protein
MEKQPELFGEFREPEIKKNIFQGGALPEKTFVFAFSREKLILFSIGFIIALAVMFAVGFEKGKKSALYKNVVRQARVVNVNPELPKTALPKPYTIQVATYRLKELAQKEGIKIKSKGFPVVIIGVNGVYQILVGEYSTEKDAQQALTILKRTYSGSYIRKR